MPQGAAVASSATKSSASSSRSLNGARIINASYGGYYYSQTEYEAIRTLRDQGVLFVAAAGNERLEQ